MNPKEQNFKNLINETENQLKFKITTDVIKNSRTITCECGGMTFSEKIIFKVLSALITSSGKEELLPIPTFVCEKCGKVPTIFDSQNILPDEIKAKNKL